MIGVFFSHLHGERDDKHKGWSNYPAVKVDWILVAVFKEVSDYKLESVEMVETLLHCGYGVVVRTQIGSEDTEKYQILLNWRAERS